MSDQHTPRTLWGDAEISKLLYEAREAIEMFADLAEATALKPAAYERGLVARIDAFRKARGWSADGFGGEDDPDRVLAEITASLADIYKRHAALSEAKARCPHVDPERGFCTRSDTHPTGEHAYPGGE